LNAFVLYAEAKSKVGVVVLLVGERLSFEVSEQG
jgi:hypothetical protein